jgi:ELWxxDGT repeat protein
VPAFLTSARCVHLLSSRHWLAQQFELIVFNSKLYFFGSDATSGRELWSCDNSNTLTRVSDINTGVGDSTTPFQVGIGRSAVFDNKLYFAAKDGSTGWELYSYDGTNTPSIVADFNSGSTSTNPVSAVQTFVLQSGGCALLPLLLLPSALQTRTQHPSLLQNCLTVFNGKLYFSGNAPGEGAELLSYNGSSIAVAHIFRSGSGGGAPVRFLRH